jgi:hypothetical protein
VFVKDDKNVERLTNVKTQPEYENKNVTGIFATFGNNNSTSTTFLGKQGMI